MSHPSKRKGDKAELEAARILAEHLGLPIRRKLGAGRLDDEGDLEGLPDFTIEVKNYANVTTGVAAGLADSTREQANAGTTHGAAMIRRPGGRWFVALTVDQFATLAREAIADAYDDELAEWWFADEEEEDR
jgi:hypothetical protein